MKELRQTDAQFTVPDGYSGLVCFLDGSKAWYKNGDLHRENGIALIKKNNYKEWWLDGKLIWDSNRQFIDFKTEIILSKTSHPEYSNIKIWKFFGLNGHYEQIIIPGMEELITE